MTGANPPSVIASEQSVSSSPLYFHHDVNRANDQIWSHPVVLYLQFVLVTLSVLNLQSVNASYLPSIQQPPHPPRYSQKPSGVSSFGPLPVHPPHLSISCPSLFAPLFLLSFIVVIGWEKAVMSCVCVPTSRLPGLPAQVSLLSPCCGP